MSNASLQSECQFETSKTTMSEEADWHHVLSTANIVFNGRTVGRCPTSSFFAPDLEIWVYSVHMREGQVCTGRKLGEC